MIAEAVEARGDTGTSKGAGSSPPAAAPVAFPSALAHLSAWRSEEAPRGGAQRRR